MFLMSRIFKRNKSIIDNENVAPTVKTSRGNVLFSGDREDLTLDKYVEYDYLSCHLPDYLNVLAINNDSAMVLYDDNFHCSDAKVITIAVNAAFKLSGFAETFMQEVVESIHSAGEKAHVDYDNMIISCSDGRRLMFKEGRGWIVTMTYFNASDSYAASIMDSIEVYRKDEPMIPGEAMKIGELRKVLV